MSKMTRVRDLYRGLGRRGTVRCIALFPGVVRELFGQARCQKGVVAGLIAAAVSGLLYGVALAGQYSCRVSERAACRARDPGGAESFIITGAVAWGLALVDKEHAGKVIARVGTAMFAAMALGGPVGTMLFEAFGFEAVALLTFLLPLLVLAYLARMPAVAPHPHAAQATFGSVMHAVWLPDWAPRLPARATVPSRPSAHFITAP